MHTFVCPDCLLNMTVTSLLSTAARQLTQPWHDDEGEFMGDLVAQRYREMVGWLCLPLPRMHYADSDPPRSARTCSQVLNLSKQDSETSNCPQTDNVQLMLQDCQCVLHERCQAKLSHDADVCAYQMEDRSALDIEIFGSFLIVHLLASENEPAGDAHGLRAACCCQIAAQQTVGAPHAVSRSPPSVACKLSRR